MEHTTVKTERDADGFVMNRRPVTQYGQDIYCIRRMSLRVTTTYSFQIFVMK